MKKVVMKVYGMTCDDCVVTVKKGLESVPGVISADVSLPEKKAEILIDENKVSPESLEDAQVFKVTRYRGEVRKVE
ncbi:heavy-metal-associated domain-containing protein [Thermoplasma sp.]|uniref:heavy-metal-associated domain-containing protein n=1 Tax=Thermoplasma sp. TaxID=1973142 RepID=UPI00126C66A8|nr:cation transporter [Thermoplasma sp.]KAA8922719.1 MAG: copper-binding protein [Thermoplasma sp.]